MPFDSNLIFLEETSVVARPILSYAETKNRMAARLRHLGIRVKSVIEEERCFIVMGGPLPKIPQSIMVVGANSVVVHPATGYTLARAMAVAPAVAGAIVECLGGGSIIRGPEMYGRVWESLWPMEKRREREYQNLGMEIMLRLDLEKTRRFVESFFEVEPRYWQGFLSGRLSLGELITFGLSSFGKASARGKLDIVTTSPVPVAKFIRNLALGDV
ncbi:Lycopene beta cyclase- chloroplastic [Striga hermonthica]|uniref:Lycopene beta cyclase- chloroplastic n=1 Tax=Striga hermonthica TaxID=68872 RepID=A0A9N7N2U9_STRHE|nr:Lycopene beta cyclase- chloroplastic [Striga hermonthica]